MNNRKTVILPETEVYGTRVAASSEVQVTFEKVVHTNLNGAFFTGYRVRAQENLP